MSINIKIYNQKAEQVGDIKLSDKIFGVKINEGLVHQAVVAQMANMRQVLAHTKDRSEVRGGGRKPWRQKGTGRARAGSIRSPIWIGGGVTFGPRKTRNFKKKINKKMSQTATMMVLSDKVNNKKFTVLDKLEISEFKTKIFDKMLKELEKKVLKSNKPLTKNTKTPASPNASQSGRKHENTKIRKQKRSLLIINDKKDDKIKFSSRNLAGIKIININNINILDLIKYKNLILTKESVKNLERKYNKSTA